MIDKKRLCSMAAQYGIELTDRQLELLDGYAEAVVEKNKVMNLTAITLPEQLEEKHLLDSLLCASLPQLCGKIADVGTGGGFPGTVIKIFKPESELVLIDATQKKLAFIGESCAAIGIELETVHGRAEELARSAEHRERYDCVTARAVANLASLCEYCLPLVRVGGFLAAMKGPEAQAELADAQNALKLLGGKAQQIKSFILPAGDERKIVLIEKISHTPPKYPRSQKNITKCPL